MFGINNIIFFLQELFLTFLFTGKSNKAPGTIGSFFSFVVILYFVYFDIINYLHLLLIVIFITFISVPIINNYEKKIKLHDSKHIVIDEFVGVALCSSIIIYFTNNIYILILGLIFFRIFDIFKFGYIGYVDKEIKGGLGVMFDDILAGICAGIVTIIIYFILKNTGII